MIEYIALFISGVVLNLFVRLFFGAGLEDKDPKMVAFWAFLSGVILVIVTLLLERVVVHALTILCITTQQNGSYWIEGVAGLH